jgi:acyl-CoA synthetase (AMP-forming)/AMP-acid ligase II
VLDRIVREAARRFGDAPAFAAPAGWPLSYRQLDRLSDEAAAGLARRGLGPGDVLGLALPSTPEYLIAYAAAAKLGAITAGVNARLAPAERAAALARVEPRLVLATDELAAGLEGEVEMVSVAEDVEGVLGPLRRRSAGAVPRALPADPERPVAVVFSSGTGGAPKPAVFAGRQLEAVARIDIGLAWGTGGRTMASTSLAHVGFTTKLPWYLMTGGTMYLLDRWRAGPALELIDRVGITNLGGVPPQLALLLARPDFDEYDVGTVATIVLGGGPATPGLLREGAARFGAAISIRYSSTESGGVGTGTDFDAPAEEAWDTVGRGRGGIGVSIRDEDDHLLPAGEIGRIHLRTPAAMSGYWRDSSATAAAFAADGVLRMGDLGWLDGRGCLRVAGRADDAYLRGGYNVHPQQVEAVLAAHPGVAEVAVVGQTDPVLGEIGVAYVVPRPGRAAPDLADLRSFAGDRLAAYKLPDRLEVVDALPLTPMDKIDRSALKHADGSPWSPGPRDRGLSGNR